MIKETSFGKIFSISLTRGLINNIKTELKEGFEVTGLNFSNPIFMILLRAAEGIIF